MYILLNMLNTNLVATADVVCEIKFIHNLPAVMTCLWKILFLNCAVQLLYFYKVLISQNQQVLILKLLKGFTLFI